MGLAPELPLGDPGTWLTMLRGKCVKEMLHPIAKTAIGTENGQYICVISTINRELVSKRSLSNLYQPGLPNSQARECCGRCPPFHPYHHLHVML